MSPRKLSDKLIALCVIIFLADIVSGLLVSTFSVYARNSGATVAAIGLINTVTGLLQLGIAIPLGTLSDRIGRFRLILGGLVAFSLAMLVLGLSATPQALWFGKLLFGIGGVAVFQSGHALVGDLTKPEERPLAFGMLTTSMALGYGLGPLVGGLLTDHLAISGPTCSRWWLGWRQPGWPAGHSEPCRANSSPRRGSRRRGSPGFGSFLELPICSWSPSPI